MKVSLNWIKQLTSVNLPIDRLVEKIGAQLGAIEEVIDTSKRYEGLLVVRVVSCIKHPNADKLSLCLVDDGGRKKDVKRNEDGLIQIVCGAPNVEAGMLAVWIPPGSTVPSTFDKDPFVIEAKPIRNKTSQGMLASAKELDISDDHSGIVVVDKDAKAGDSFAELYHMNDYVIDIENKMFTHRPDCFGMLGLARELAGIQQQAFKSPDWYRENASLPADGRKNVLKLSINNELPELVPRFCAVAVKDVKVGPSPVWLQASLSRVGVKSINNIVDLTNFYMLLTGQPLHAYDYDKVKTGVLGVRLSKKGEKLELLNGKEVTLDKTAVVITDGERPIGLGGIMGGAGTEVDENTRSIILECANFDMNQTRKTAMEYGLFTDAATRFTKNQSPRQNMAVIVKVAEDILRLGGGRVASAVLDDKHYGVDSTPVDVSPEFINARLGLDLSPAEIKKLLENVEFKVETAGKLKVTPPFWRTDIEIPEDIVEEVGRLYGYDKLPVVLPERKLAPAERNQLADFKDDLRDILASAGANEVLTYSFVHGSLMEKTGQDPAQAYRIINALSPDLQFYRLSLTPSLLSKIYPNYRAGCKEFAIFELGKGHNKLMKEKTAKHLPREFEMLSLVFTSGEKSPKRHGAPFYQAKNILQYVAERLEIELSFRPIPKEEPFAAAKPFDHERSAQVWDAAGKVPLGMVGEYRQSVLANLKLPEYSAGFEIGIEELMSILPEHSAYLPLSRFPEVEQDFCLQAPADSNYAELSSFVHANLEKLSQPAGYSYQLQPLDIYQRQSDEKHKQTTWRIMLWHPQRTLTVKETNLLLDELAASAKKELKAERI